MWDQTRGTRAAIVSGALLLLVVTPLAPPGSSAFLTDASTVGGNTAQIGTFDAALSEEGPHTENSTVDEQSVDEARDTWEDYSHENESVDPVNNTLRIENPSTTYDTDHVNITFTYAQNDSGVNDLVDDSTETAKSLNVSVLEYGGTDLLSQRVTDTNGNGALDVDDVAAANLSRLGGISAGGNKTLTMSVSGDSTSNNNVAGGDGIDFLVEIELATRTSWRDTDRSTDNTIQYSS